MSPFCYLSTALVLPFYGLFVTFLLPFYCLCATFLLPFYSLLCHLSATFLQPFVPPFYYLSTAFVAVPPIFCLFTAFLPPLYLYTTFVPPLCHLSATTPSHPFTNHDECSCFPVCRVKWRETDLESADKNPGKIPHPAGEITKGTAHSHHLLLLHRCKSHSYLALRDFPKDSFFKRQFSFILFRDSLND